MWIWIFFVLKKLDFIEAKGDFHLIIYRKRYIIYTELRRKEVVKMSIEKSDWEWLISIITSIAVPLIIEWMKAKGLFNQHHRK